LRPPMQASTTGYFNLSLTLYIPFHVVNFRNRIFLGYSNPNPNEV
jgi:hypothetical protein